MVYKLDPVDASERKLVKQIEVASMEVDGGHNRPFVRCLSAANKKGTISAKVELDVEHMTHVSREVVTVSDGDDLQQTTGRALQGTTSFAKFALRKAKNSSSYVSPANPSTSGRRNLR
jgi:type III restriction enzyme